jgi:hypothetical protein
MNTLPSHDFVIFVHFDSFELHFLKAGRFYMSEEHHMDTSPGFQSKQEVHVHMLLARHNRL